MLIFHIGGQKNAVPGHTSSSAAPSREYKLSKTGNRKTPINLINFTYEKKISMKCETFFQKGWRQQLLWLHRFSTLWKRQAGKLKKPARGRETFAPRNLLNCSYCGASSHTQHFIKIWWHARPSGGGDAAPTVSSLRHAKSRHTTLTQKNPPKKH